MMSDYNVSDHWEDADPSWLKSLVSSLDRRHGTSSIVPLTVVLDEILSWVELASGPDAWRKPANRDSLQMDLDQSLQEIGDQLRTAIGAPVATFQAAFNRLINSGRAMLSQPPGTRTHPTWSDVVDTARSLIATLTSDAAVGACWDDLLNVAQNRALLDREYRPIAELLFEQLNRRGLNAEATFSDIVSTLSYGQPFGVQRENEDLPVEQRLRAARLIACTAAAIEPVVVWLGYLGPGFPRLSAGRVTFLDGRWAVPNARPEGQVFQHKEELWEIVQYGGMFRVAENVDEESEIDFLVRVDLGETTAAGAESRAIRIVDTILNVSIHYAGGARPNLTQYSVLSNGRSGASGVMLSPRDSGFPNDFYGGGITADAIDEHGPGVAEALAREELPVFLAAALDVQMTANHPFSREMALRTPSEADIISVIPLADRVVQHIAAHAALDPNDTFDMLGLKWPHARWLTDVRRAVHMCLLGGGPRRELVDELRREWFNLTRPWVLFVTERSADLLSLCRIESERAWIERILQSVGDHASYAALIDDYAEEAQILEARRRRLRNALVHGNPASFAIIGPVREYAEFLSGTALHLALESYVSASSPAAALESRTAEFVAMSAGTDAATYWQAHTTTDVTSS